MGLDLNPSVGIPQKKKNKRREDAGTGESRCDGFPLVALAVL